MGLHQSGLLLRKRGREEPLIPDGEDPLPFAAFSFLLLTQSCPWTLTRQAQTGPRLCQSSSDKNEWPLGRDQ